VILVVEDEPAIRGLAVESLRDAGHHVLEAGTGDEAIRLFEDHPEIALIFTDIVMPGIDGFKVADMAKVRRPDVKILYVTGFEYQVEDFLGVVHGPILWKPYQPSDLVTAVDEALAANDRLAPHQRARP